MSFDPNFESWLTKKLGAIKRRISDKGDDSPHTTTSAQEEVHLQGQGRGRGGIAAKYYSRQQRYQDLARGSDLSVDFLDNEVLGNSGCAPVHRSTNKSVPSAARTLRWVYSNTTGPDINPQYTPPQQDSTTEFDYNQFYNDDDYELENAGIWGPYERHDEAVSQQQAGIAGIDLDSSGLTSYKAAMSTGNYYSITFDPDEEDEEMPVFDREVMSARDQVDRILRETELQWDEDDPGRISSAASSTTDLSVISRRPTARLNTKGLFADDNEVNGRPRSLLLDHTTRDVNSNGIPSKMRGSGTDILDALDLLETESNYSEGGMSHAYSEDGYIVFNKLDDVGVKQNGFRSSVTSRGEADGASQTQSPGAEDGGKRGAPGEIMHSVRFRKLKSDFDQREDYMEDDEVNMYQEDELDDDEEDFELEQGAGGSGFPMDTARKGSSSDTGSIVRVRLPMEQFEMTLDPGDEDDTMLSVADDYYSRPEVDISDTQPIVMVDQAELAVAMVKRTKRRRLVAVSVTACVVGVAAVTIIVYLVVKWLTIV